jgi:mannose-6-phosphate isomerase-like protein (cupin superfamily)
MKHVKAADGKRFQNSMNCIAIEYLFEGEEDINNAVIELNGRYPDKGLSLNEVCKEVIYVIEGNGIIGDSINTFNLTKDDMVQIESGEQYYLEGKMKLLISSAPAWYPEQYKIVF